MGGKELEKPRGADVRRVETAARGVVHVVRYDAQPSVVRGLARVGVQDDWWTLTISHRSRWLRGRLGKR
jgi:hypothetical protein